MILNDQGLNSAIDEVPSTGARRNQGLCNQALYVEVSKLLMQAVAVPNSQNAQF